MEQVSLYKRRDRPLTNLIESLSTASKIDKFSRVELLRIKFDSHLARGTEIFIPKVLTGRTTFRYDTNTIFRNNKYYLICNIYKHISTTKILSYKNFANYRRPGNKCPNATR